MATSSDKIAIRGTRSNVCWGGLLLLLATFGACSSEQTYIRTDKKGGTPIPVCTVFTNIQSYRDKLITVRGIYWNGLRQPCADPFITGNHRWPTALNLVDSDFVAKEGAPVNFRTDVHSWNRLDDLAIREGKAGHLEEIWVTVVGKLQCPATYIRSNGEIVGGYGHLGELPAQLVVKRMFDIEVRATPTYDYAEMVKKAAGHVADKVWRLSPIVRSIAEHPSGWPLVEMASGA